MLTSAKPGRRNWCCSRCRWMSRCAGQPGAASLSDLLGAEDPRLEHMLGMQAVARHWGELPVREQQIVVLRYYRGMTQAQIGQQLGISQVQVSRLLARALGYLRPRLFGQPGFVTDAVLGPAPRAGPHRCGNPARGGPVALRLPTGRQRRSLTVFGPGQARTA